MSQVQQFLQAAQEGIYLRYPDPINPQRELTYEAAMNLLIRGAATALNTPFQWAYIDKPMEGAIYLLFHPPSIPFAIDGIRYQDAEAKYTIPAGGRELEVCEAKFGFIPGSQDPNAWRVRRRYRLTKGGNASLMLVHYARGQATHINPALNTPVRTHPPRPLNEPAMYVAGEKMGQKVFPPGPGGGPGAGGAPMPGGPAGMGPPAALGGMGMNFAQQQALLAQQNQSMEALDQRRRERERAAAQERSGPPRGDPAGARPPPPRMAEEDDSGDEVDQISSRTLALARYKRNHDWMSDVFNQAAFGTRNAPPKPSPYSIFSKSEIDAKTAKLQAELEALQATGAQRRADKIRDAQTPSMSMSMGSGGESVAV